jgi:hypothetical protein
MISECQTYKWGDIPIPVETIRADLEIGPDFEWPLLALGNAASRWLRRAHIRWHGRYFRKCP